MQKKKKKKKRIIKRSKVIVEHGIVFHFGKIDRSRLSHRKKGKERIFPKDELNLQGLMSLFN